MMSSFVLEVLSARMLTVHYFESSQTSSMKAAPFDISPTAVVSSANIIIVFVLWVGVQSWV